MRWNFLNARTSSLQLVWIISLLFLPIICQPWDAGKAKYCINAQGNMLQCKNQTQWDHSIIPPTVPGLCSRLIPLVVLAPWSMWPCPAILHSSSSQEQKMGISWKGNVCGASLNGAIPSVWHLFLPDQIKLPSMHYKQLFVCIPLPEAFNNKNTILFFLHICC